MVKAGLPFFDIAGRQSNIAEMGFTEKILGHWECAL